MKVVQKNNPTSYKRIIVPSIPFERPEPKKYSKENTVVFKNRSNPGDVDSTTYDVTVPIFKEGTTEELIDWKKKVDQVLVGQNITTGPQKYALMHRVLDGDALAAFNNAATQLGNETNPNFTQAYQRLVEHVVPRRALATQKRYLRHFVRKNKYTSMHDFMSCLVEINDKLAFYPPFGANQSLAEDELMDIAEFATPHNWQHTMVMHDFDPMAHTPNELIEFCECLEFAEPPVEEQKPSAASKNNNGKVSTKKTSTNKRERQEFYCEYHGANKTHDTAQCKVILDQVKRMKGAYETHRKKFSWNKKEDDEKKKCLEKRREEIKAMIEWEVKDTIAGKKRKPNPEENLNIEQEYDVLDEFEDMISLSDNDNNDEKEE